MRIRSALAAAIAAMLLAADRGAAAELIPPDQRLMIAEVTFQNAVKAGEDATKSRSLFHGAAEDYQKLVDMGCDDPDLFLNLGNAHFLAGELPQAILAYRHGLQRNPLHARLWENLEAARNVVGYTDGAPRHRPDGDDWPPWLPRPAPELLLGTALVLHGLAWLAVGAWLVMRRLSVCILAVLLFVASGGAGAWWGYLDYRIAQDQDQPLVVVAFNGMPLRRGNGTLYPRVADLPQVNRGMEGRQVNERGGWVQVQFPGGQVGWLPRTAVIP